MDPTLMLSGTWASTCDHHLLVKVFLLNYHYLIDQKGRNRV
ncbi:unnamed protein product [Prunus brigantina]